MALCSSPMMPAIRSGAFVPHAERCPPLEEGCPKGGVVRRPTRNHQSFWDVYQACKKLVNVLKTIISVRIECPRNERPVGSAIWFGRRLCGKFSVRPDSSAQGGQPRPARAGHP